MARLRGALITALERAGQARERAHWADRRGEIVEPLETGYYFPLIRLVAALSTPQAIPALITVLGSGRPPEDALVRFGRLAVDPVVEAVLSSEYSHYVVGGGLRVLRFMVEESTSGARPLLPQDLDGIRAVAEARLTGEQRHAVLWNAIDLAAALDDPGLWSVLEAIASDPDEVAARGVTDSRRVALTQRFARERLDGIGPPDRR